MMMLMMNGWLCSTVIKVHYEEKQLTVVIATSCYRFSVPPPQKWGKERQKTGAFWTGGRQNICLHM